MRKLLSIACLAVLSLTVQASNETVQASACKVEEKRRWNDPGFSRRDGPEYDIFYECKFGNDVAISTLDTKLTNRRNEDVSEINGNNITGLEYLPIDIVEAFPGVKLISISNTNLKTLSKKNFHGLGKIRNLDFSRNKISLIDGDSFDDCIDIFSIDLDDNELTTLPANVFAKLASLDTLHLNNNQLTTLHADTFKKNHKLALLIMNDNKLTTFAPDTFDSQTLMRQVWLHKNEISSLNSDWFKNCASLGDLTFGENKISEIPLNFTATLSSLRQISFSHNPISTIDFKMFENNKQINRIAFNDIKVEKVLNIDVVFKLPKLQGVHFKINDDSCIIGTYHEGTLNKLKQEVMENCKTE